MVRVNKFKIFIYLFISILFYILAFPPFNFSFLIFFTLIPLFSLLPEITQRKAFILGFLYGIGYNSVNFYWIPRLVSHFTSIGLSIFVYLLLIIYLSLYYGVFLWGVKRKENSIFFPAFFMVFIQWIRCHGPLAFNWGSFGEPLVHIYPLLQWASIFGELGLVFLVVLVNTVIARFRESDFKRKISFIFVFISLFIVGIFIGRGDYNSFMKVGAVQGSYDSFSKYFYTNIYDQFQVHKELTLNLPDNLDLVVWAESVLFCFLNHSPIYLKELGELAEFKNTNLLLGSLEMNGRNIYNSAYLITRDGRYKVHRKVQLVPFVEEVPFPFNYVIPEYFRGLIGNYSSGPGFYPLSIDGKKIGVLICFESLFSDPSKILSQRHSDIIVVITNDGWFQGTPAVYQHKNQSLLRGVENRRPIVQVANTGITFFADPYGRIIKETKEGEKVAIYGEVPKGSFSFYTFWGDMPMFLGFLIFLLIKLIKE